VRQSSTTKEQRMIEYWPIFLVAGALISGGIKVTFGNISINSRNKKED